MRNKSKPLFYNQRLVSIRNCLLVVGGLVFCNATYPPYALAQRLKPKSYNVQSVTSNPLSGYNQVGDTRIYYYQSANIDIIGRFQAYYYGSTYHNGGYKVSLKVNNGSAKQLNCLNGGQLDGVSFRAWVEAQGELARVCYSFTNTNTEEVTISAGTHADVMIGSNDLAPISKRIDNMGNPYGVTMSDGNGAQLCVLFGAGLKGVTSVNDYWFGHYSTNYQPNQMVGNYTQGRFWMQENGSYDSGMGWCWKDRKIAAGETLVLSYLIGVGEVNLEPNSNVEVTPDDPDGWNDLSRPHRLTLTGTYDSPAGLDGKIEYAVEDSEEWQAVTDTISSGSEFSESIVVNFTEGRPKHTIKLRTVDNVGNTTSLPSIEYIDIASHDFIGTQNYTYTGDSIYQSNVTSDIPTEQFTLKNYQGNVNAGTASYSVEGVFPYSIGRRSYQFAINPQPLRGEITMSDSAYVYNGAYINPKWNFTEDTYKNLIEGKDYTKQLANNLLPGTATITIEGQGNYTSSLSAQFDIDKAQLNNSLYNIELPDADITYDAEQHVANVSKANGVGNINISYTKQDGTEVASPTNEGTYTAFAEIEDGSLYYGLPKHEIGNFTIYNLNATEWQTLLLLNQTLATMGRTQSWDITQGIKGVSKWQGVKVKEGHINELNLSGQNITGELPNALYGLSTLEKLDLSNNHLTGNVGILGQALPKLKSLNVSHNAFANLYPMLPTTIDEVNIGSQKIDKTIVLDGSNFDVATIAPQLPTILAYNHKEQKYDTNLSLAITTANTLNEMANNDAWTIYASMVNGKIVIPYVSTNNVYYGQTGDTLQAFKLNSNLQAEGSECKVKYIFEQGDSNFNPGVDATDLQATILYAFGGYGRYPFNHTAADTYRDGTINVQDVVATVNIILQKALAQSSYANRKRQLLASEQALTASTEKSEAVVYLHNGKVMLYSERPVSALSIEAIGNIEWNMQALGMEQSTRSANLVAYSLSGNELPTLQVIEIGTYTDKAEILSASLADINAQAISTSLDANAITAIKDVLNTNNANTQIYNTKGIKTNKLQKGVNIIKRGNQTNKVIIN